MPDQHNAPALHVRLTEVTVCALPEDDVNYHSYAITVSWRGGESYAVVHVGYCLSVDGGWDYEPMVSSRDDEWLAAHRWAYDTAYRLACEQAPLVEVNGKTATGVSRG
jgi:hypothetical protein